MAIASVVYPLLALLVVDTIALTAIAASAMQIGLDAPDLAIWLDGRGGEVLAPLTAAKLVAIGTAFGMRHGTLRSDLAMLFLASVWLWLAFAKATAMHLWSGDILLAHLDPLPVAPKLAGLILIGLVAVSLCYLAWHVARDERERQPIYVTVVALPILAICAIGPELCWRLIPDLNRLALVAAELLMETLSATVLLASLLSRMRIRNLSGICRSSVQPI